MSKSFAVFGLGRFGRKVATSLYESGYDVMGVDNNPDIIEETSDKLTYAIEADISKAEVIKGLGLEHMDVVIVSMGENLAASIMSVMVSKEIGIPYVIAKAADEMMGSILKKVGADRIIYPEEESGQRTAKLLMSDSFLEFFEIDNELCILEIKAKKQWIGKTLKELDLRKNYKINIIAVKEEGKMHLVIDPDRKIEEDDDFLVAADPSKLKLIV